MGVGPHGVGDGDGVARGALLRVGGGHEDLPELGGGLGQGPKAGAIDAVVVGHQDPHGLTLAFSHQETVKGRPPFPGERLKESQGGLRVLPHLQDHGPVQVGTEPRPVAQDPRPRFQWRS